MPSIIDIAERIRDVMYYHRGPDDAITQEQIKTELQLRWPYLGRIDRGEMSKAIKYCRIELRIPIIPCENHLQGMYWATRQSQIRAYCNHRRGELLGELWQVRRISQIKVEPGIPVQEEMAL